MKSIGGSYEIDAGAMKLIGRGAMKWIGGDNEIDVGGGYEIHGWGPMKL